MLEVFYGRKEGSRPRRLCPIEETRWSAKVTHHDHGSNQVVWVALCDVVPLDFAQQVLRSASELS